MMKSWIKENMVRQADLAQRLNVSRGYLSELVNGNKTPSLEMAVRIECLTGGSVKPSDWFTQKDIEAFKVAQAEPLKAVG